MTVRLRWLADYEADHVASGTPLGSTGPDEILEVPDEVFAGHVWPEELWSVVSGPQDDAPAKSSKTGGK